ncbi:MAG: Uma2 family endonuclease [Deltaproteobacteria bacterium]|nr:Uma2 family endonuclease [Nannocystaceae bacterium]
MSGAATTQRMSAAEYLEWERAQPDKHEFHLGEVFGMAGGSPRHNYLAIAVAGELRAAARGRGCVVLSSDQRIAAMPGARYVYADAVVVCGGVQTEAAATDVLSNPTVVIEVLSTSTEAYDRGAKWEAYQRIPTLTDYLLVAQNQVRVEHYHRESDGAWRYQVWEAGTSATVAEGLVVAIDAVYAGAFELED